jgi:uncharacterized coiled-coil protein SlyX
VTVEKTSSIGGRMRRFVRGADDRASDARVAGLESRIGHLEAALEGLQDAVHREAVRHDHDTAELHKRLEPSIIARELSEDARRRGL